MTVSYSAPTVGQILGQSAVTGNSLRGALSFLPALRKGEMQCLSKAVPFLPDNSGPEDSNNV